MNINKRVEYFKAIYGIPRTVNSVETKESKDIPSEKQNIVIVCGKVSLTSGNNKLAKFF